MGELVLPSELVIRSNGSKQETQVASPTATPFAPIWNPSPPNQSRTDLVRLPAIGEQMGNMEASH